MQYLQWQWHVPYGDVTCGKKMWYLSESNVPTTERRQQRHSALGLDPSPSPNTQFTHAYTGMGDTLGHQFNKINP